MEENTQLLYDMVDEARHTYKVIYCRYQGLWWTPKEFLNALDAGKFRWNRDDFLLRDPGERTRQLEEARDKAVQEMEKWENRVRY